MFNYTKDGITVSIVHDTRRALADGGYPVKIRVTKQRVQKYYSTGKSLTEQEWGTLWTAKNKELIAKRKDIENSFEIVKAAVQELAYAGNFSHVRLANRLRHNTTTSLNKLFAIYIEDLEATQSIRTASVYSNTIANIEKFAGANIPFDMVTPRWLERCEAFWKNEGKTSTSISMYMRSLRAVFNYGIKEGLLRQSDYPFGRGKYEIQEGEGRKLALDIKQIGQIARYDDGDDLTRKYRDLWMFLYYCNGINMADFVQLKFKDIVNGEIRFTRQKTANTAHKRKEIAVVVTEPMRQIIARWGNVPAPDNYIFPFLDGKESVEERIRKTQNATRAINQRMKKVGKALRIGTPTTYTTRHSFATVLKRSGANIAYISESLGHTDIKTTEHYLASFERDEREKNAALLTKF